MGLEESQCPKSACLSPSTNEACKRSLEIDKLYVNTIYILQVACIIYIYIYIYKYELHYIYKCVSYTCKDTRLRTYVHFENLEIILCFITSAPLEARCPMVAQTCAYDSK